MRQLLREWSVAEYAVGLYPERADRHPHVLDRVLAYWAGWLALWASALLRWATAPFRSASAGVRNGTRGTRRGGAAYARAAALGTPGARGHGRSRRGRGIRAGARGQRAAARHAPFPGAVDGRLRAAARPRCRDGNRGGQEPDRRAAGGHGRAGRSPGARDHGQRVPGASRCAGNDAGVCILRPVGGLDRAGSGPVGTTRDVRTRRELLCQQGPGVRLPEGRTRRRQCRQRAPARVAPFPRRPCCGRPLAAARPLLCDRRRGRQHLRRRSAHAADHLGRAAGGSGRCGLPVRACGGARTAGRCLSHPRCRAQRTPDRCRTRGRRSRRGRARRELAFPPCTRTGGRTGAGRAAPVSA
jgi:hypothetical protein